MRETIHPTAIVEDGATLELGVFVWHHAHVRTGATVGANTSLGKDVFVDEGVRIGRNCKVQNGAQLYKGCRVGDGVFIGPHVILTNDKYPRAVGPEGDERTSDEWIQGLIQIGDGVSLGAGSVVISGVHIGDWAAMGAGAVVTRNVEPHSLVVGVPGRVVGHVCYCGRAAHAIPCEECGWSA